MKRKACLLALCIAFSGVASAAVYWDNGTGNNNYADPLNWNSFPDALPAVNLTGGDRAIVSTDTETLSTQATTVYIGNNTGTNGEIEVASTGHLYATQYVHVGYSGTGLLTVNGGTVTTDTRGLVLGWNSGSDGTMIMNSGTINCNYYAYVGKSGTGYLQMNGGVFNQNINDFLVADNSGSSGTIDMYDGTINAVRDLTIGDADNGTLNMYGGTINVNRFLEVGVSGTGTVNLYGGTINALTLSALSTGSLLNITDGTLVLGGDVAAAILANPQIVAYGGGGQLLADNQSVAGKTIVTAVPEPATMMLLGLGSLALIRRRR